MKKQLTFSINIKIKEKNLKEFISFIMDIISQIIMEISRILIPEIEKDYYKLYLGEKGKIRLKDKKTPFHCSHCGNDNSSNFEYKGYEKKYIGVKWFFGRIEYKPQMIRCKKCGHREYYFAKNFGLCESSYSRDFLEFGLFLVLNMSYNMVIKYLKKIFVNCYCVMTLWREIQGIGSNIEFELPNNSNLFLADGTGVHIGTNKRGKELRFIMAQSNTGSFRVVNINIKDYKTKWKDDFSILAKHDGLCVCIADGDPDIEEAFLSVKGEDGVFQRDLWHLPRQFKWYCWKDNVSKEYKTEFLSLLYQIIFIPKSIDNHSVDLDIISSKEKLFDGLIEWCKELGYKHCERYLIGAKGKLFEIYKSNFDFFKFYSCSSIIERAMREINRREEIGVRWSDKGLLNLMKLKMCQLYHKPLWNKLFSKIINKNYKFTLSLCDSG